MQTFVNMTKESNKNPKHITKFKCSLSKAHCHPANELRRPGFKLSHKFAMAQKLYARPKSNRKLVKIVMRLGLQQLRLLSWAKERSGRGSHLEGGLIEAVIFIRLGDDGIIVDVWLWRSWLKTLERELCMGDVGRDGGHFNGMHLTQLARALALRTDGGDVWRIWIDTIEILY